MLTVKEFAHKLGRLQLHVNRAYVCKNNIIHMNNYVKVLKGRQSQANTLCTLYGDNLKDVCPDVADKTMEQFHADIKALAGDASAQVKLMHRMVHLTRMTFEYLNECHKKEKILTEAEESMQAQEALFRHLAENRAAVMDILEDVRPWAAQLRAEDMLTNATKCLADTDIERVNAECGDGGDGDGGGGVV